MASDSLNFRVRSTSGDDVYEISAELQPALRITCTCQAGIYGMACRHRTALLLGDVTSVIEVDTDAIEALSSAAANSPLGRVLAELAELEGEVERLKRRVSAKKKQVARIMNHGA